MEIIYNILEILLYVALFALGFWGGLKFMEWIQS
jgi:hypothetical protein